jgi:17beta-estradiol 17-dehydrogenase / very-long-chain 3-oxoacyl-CoA reductase
MPYSSTQLKPSLPLAFAKSISSIIGTIWILRKLVQIVSFIWLHFCHSGNLDRYTKTKSGKSPWAIVTGASDGVGQGFVEELLDRGFNLVLHGRNENKLKGIVEELRLRWPQRDFKLLILDASMTAMDSTKIQHTLRPLEHLELKILINNVGGNGGEESFLQLIEEQSAESVDTW